VIKKSINYSYTNINGATQTLTNKLNNKFQVMDIKFLRGTRKKMRIHKKNGMSPAAVTKNLLT
jgi:hypothetical protein